MSIERFGLALLALLAALAFVPGVDLAVTGLFYSKDAWFFWRYAPPLEFIRKALPTLVIGSGIFFILVGLANLILKSGILGMTWRKMVYLTATMLLGPGLVINLLFKEHWGRARPSTITEFGGKLLYSPPLVFSDQCDDNCSFASGHAAIAFWLFALAMLAPPAWRRRAGWAAICFGFLIGLVRVIQGAHFYSDVVSAGIVTVGIALALKPMIKDGHDPA
jgi:lipid A 4'-phosphatase